ncbi:Alanine--tRNA ligase, mitochondrial [Lamellibrachia satsuma]|nr:Alanine--tRNA ligase, mitochondrial [Lamellibrachia satsuma]
MTFGGDSKTRWSVLSGVYARGTNQTWTSHKTQCRNHLFVPSSSVIPKKDEGTYFINAGVNQFKPLFLGTVDPQSDMASYRSVVKSQKCICVGR